MKNNKEVKAESVLKDYWGSPDRFADLFNQVFFDGEELLVPEQLLDKDVDESTVIQMGKKIATVARRRDIMKEYDNGIDLVLIGLEDQMNIHYAMPVRNMLYDSLRYTRQCKELENINRLNGDLKGPDEFLSGVKESDRIKPIISLIVYYGEEEWNGPRCLSDMMNIPPRFERLFSNHNIHLLHVREAVDYPFKNADNQDFFAIIGEFYKAGKKMDMKSFKEKYFDKEIYWETLVAIGAATGSQKLIRYAQNREGGKVNMCKALEHLERQGELRGEKRGEKRGELRGEQRAEIRDIGKMIYSLRKFLVNDELIIEEIKEQFSLNDEEAKGFM